MTVEYDKAPLPGQQRQKRRVASAPASLINRIQKPPLLERLGNSKPPASSNRVYVCMITKSASGHDLRLYSRKAQELGPIRTKSARTARPGPKKPKTAEELDQELDSFMKDDTKASATKTAEASLNGGIAPAENTLSTAQVTVDVDVEMS